MKEISLISRFTRESTDKCQSSTQCKITKKPCKLVERESGLLDLGHIDLGDLK